MKGLTASEALSHGVKRVAADGRPQIGDIARRHDTVYAVFDPGSVPPRHGLAGIRRRARALQGKATIKSSPHEGTIVLAEFPVAQDTAGAGVVAG